MQRLKPRLQPISTARLKTLDTKAGATPRIYGDTWMAIRRRILLRDSYTCKCCGLVNITNQVDHIRPLEAGGLNDDGNLQTLCVDCHKAKTATEAKQRWAGAG